MNRKQFVIHTAREAKREGIDPAKVAPPKDSPLHKVFTDEYERFQPRTKRC